jgi:hypothetical protein
MAVQQRIAWMLIAAAMLVAGCGGGAVETDREPSSEFHAKGPNAPILKAGKEADPEEREAASQVVEESLAARASEDWEGQCGTLAAPLIKGIEEAGKALGAKGCAKSLEAQAAPTPPAARANTLTGAIDALRGVRGRGFALYHGTGGRDYVMPLVKEAGEWKVASLTEQELR